jgi:hypothetical protein
LASVSDVFFRHSISNGHPDTPMAAYSERHGRPLSDAEIGALVAFNRGWQREPTVGLSSAPVAGEADAGRVGFSEHCARRHGPNGEGRTAVSLSKPEFLAADQCSRSNPDSHISDGSLMILDDKRAPFNYFLSSILQSMQRSLKES